MGKLKLASAVTYIPMAAVSGYLAFIGLFAFNAGRFLSGCGGGGGQGRGAGVASILIPRPSFHVTAAKTHMRLSSFPISLLSSLPLTQACHS